MATQILPEMEAIKQPTERVEIPTEHPHIVRIESEGWYPILRGSRIPVWLIASLYKQGDSPEDIHASYRHLKRAAIYDAISYYLDHKEEIEAEIESNKLENVLRKHNGRIVEGGFIVFDKPVQVEGKESEG
ncbi:MAG: DUF433 domain-containing protein [Chloroflexi bacterium]|nr:DUF433 domain-containing protein [Chloroflexota bacterium]